MPNIHRDEPVKCRATLALLPDLLLARDEGGAQVLWWHDRTLVRRPLRQS